MFYLKIFKKRKTKIADRIATELRSNSLYRFFHDDSKKLAVLWKISREVTDPSDVEELLSGIPENIVLLGLSSNNKIESYLLDKVYSITLSIVMDIDIKKKIEIYLFLNRNASNDIRRTLTNMDHIASLD